MTTIKLNKKPKSRKGDLRVGTKKIKNMDSYNAGNGPQQIDLSVDVNTIGLAASRAILGTPGSETPPIASGHSVNATGDIATTQIGGASTLQSKTLSIMTKIDLSIIGDEEARKKECERATSTYILDNGIEGHKVFSIDDNDKTPSDDYSTIIIYKEIKLG